jgi:hypothetical protein
MREALIMRPPPSRTIARRNDAIRSRRLHAEVMITLTVLAVVMVVP